MDKEEELISFLLGEWWEREIKVDKIWELNISKLIELTKERGFEEKSMLLLPLAALLRAKCESFFTPPSIEKGSFDLRFLLDREVEEILVGKKSRERKARIEELIRAFEELLKAGIKEKERRKRAFSFLRKRDLIELMHRLEEIIFDALKEKEVIAFSTIAPMEKEEIIYYFISLIHLANKGKIELLQEDGFEEIYIKASD